MTNVEDFFDVVIKDIRKSVAEYVTDYKINGFQYTGSNGEHLIELELDDGTIEIKIEKVNS